MLGWHMLGTARMVDPETSVVNEWGEVTMCAIYSSSMAAFS